jgi:hypothetical protein
MALAFGMIGGAMAQGQVVTGPSISMDKEVHDYGDVPFGGDGFLHFRCNKYWYRAFDYQPM